MKLTGKVGWAIIVLVFPVLGLFTGWLVGVSRESAVNALLPLIFALAGSLSYGILENVLKSRKITNLLETIEDEEVRKIAEATIRPGLTPSLTSPALWACGVLLFCAFSFMGIQLGVNQRSANYLSLIDFLDSIEVVDATPRQNNYGVEILAATSGTNVQAPPNLQQIELVTATAHQLALPEERAALHLLWWQMQSKNIPEDDARAFVIDAIVPMLQGPNKAYELRQIVTDFSEARIEQESTNPNVSPIN